MQTSPTTSVIFTAINAVQCSGKAFTVKERKNSATNSKYANLGDILESLMPLMKEQGLSFTQFMGNIVDVGSGIHACGLVTRIMHNSGEWIEHEGQFPLAPPPVSKSGNQILNHSQNHGLAMTYARRYALISAFGIATGDDDDAQRLARIQHETAKPKVGGTNSTAEPTIQDVPDDAPEWALFTQGAWQDQEGPAGRLGDMKPLELRDLMNSAKGDLEQYLCAAVADKINARLKALGVALPDALTARKWTGDTDIWKMDLATLRQAANALMS